MGRHIAGDINMSALNRHVHVKDSGTLFPGHGGMLDRVDSLTYTAPLFFHFIYWQFLFHTHGALQFSPSPQFRETCRFMPGR